MPAPEREGDGQVGGGDEEQVGDVEQLKRESIGRFTDEDNFETQLEVDFIEVEEETAGEV